MPTITKPGPITVGERVRLHDGTVTVIRVRSWTDCGQRVTRAWARYPDGSTTAFYSQRHPEARS